MVVKWKRWRRKKIFYLVLVDTTVYYSIVLVDTTVHYSIVLVDTTVHYRHARTRTQGKNLFWSFFSVLKTELNYIQHGPEGKGYFSSVSES